MNEREAYERLKADSYTVDYAGFLQRQSDIEVLWQALTAQAQEIERLREIAKGVDDGGHWYSQQTMDAVVRERDELREKVERTERSRDMWKAQVERQAAALAALRRAIEVAKP